MNLLDFSYLLPKENLAFAEEESEVFAERTYGMDLEKGRLFGKTEGEDALRQCIFKILSTEQGVYPIYSKSYGVVLEDLRGVDAPLAESELKRRISEALLTDSRITAVKEFVFQRCGDTLRVSFTVIGEELAITIDWEVDVI